MTGRRALAVRCDGDERTGAGHVARCIPVAAALGFHGWEPVFVGEYAGLARWLVEQAGLPMRTPEAGGCCGLHRDEWDAAIVDLYGAPDGDLCALAARVPVATMGEASRCPTAGVRVDYHLDRDGDGPSARELPGPGFAPLDPGLPAHRRAPDREVRTALVATGGSTSARRIADEAIAALRATFPGVHVIAGSGVATDHDVETLPFPGTLHAAIARADVAVSGAGLTAYELACAGVPAVLVGVADNQRRVLEGSRQVGTAVVCEPGDSIAAAVGQFADGAVRERIARAGVARFDGAGAPRTAALLDALWRGGDVDDVVLRPAVPGDRDRLLAWRNDPLTREASFSTASVSEVEHDGWLAQSLARPDRRLMVAEQAGTPIAQLRLDRDADAARDAEVSITVAPEVRGRRLGPAVLAAADAAARDWQADRLIARIKPSNVRSRRIFATAGYVDAPESAGEELVMHKRLAGGDGYDRDLFATFAELEPTSWWFRSRNRLIERMVRDHFPGAGRVLEVGCGTGYTYGALSAALPAAHIVGTELFEEGLEVARRRLPGAELVAMDVRAMPYEERFDLVAAFDVLEHIDDDRGAIAGMRRALVPGGGLIVTVPQHPFLWSDADTYAHHERRYRRRELVGRVTAAGFRVERVTSFVTFLAPLMVLSRLRSRVGAPFDPLAEFRIPRALDRAFEGVAAAERRLIERGASLPFGGSLLLVARRL